MLVNNLENKVYQEVSSEKSSVSNYQQSLEDLVNLRKVLYQDPKFKGFRIYDSDDIADYTDSGGVTFVIREGESVIGGAKLTLSQPSNPVLLPFEQEYRQQYYDRYTVKKLFPELDIAKTKYGEFSRLFLMPEFRDGNVLKKVFSYFVAEMISYGVRYIFIMTDILRTRRYVRIFKSLDVDIYPRMDLVLPDKDDFEGHKMFLTYIDFGDKLVPTNVAKSINMGKIRFFDINNSL